ncbi:MAG TPA: DUF1003 domain-containing protein [Ktedonobacteraceae bacterium]
MQPQQKTATSSQEDFEIEPNEELIELKKAEYAEMSTSDKIADKITTFSGSMLYVGLHVIWFGGWIIFNLGWFGLRPFDPFPFSLLTMIVSLEAIFLSSFVLISQNKQAHQADKRAEIDLKVNMVDEKETTKILLMVAEIQEHLGIISNSENAIKPARKITDIRQSAE